MRRLLLTCLIAGLPLVSGCATTGGGDPHFAGEEREKSGVEFGIASFYASRFHGRATASGERHDRDELTAAHRTLPFGTRVRVTNLANDKHVVVRINDRGPFVRGRIIDVSRRAADELGFVRQGTTRVEVQVLDD